MSSSQPLPRSSHSAVGVGRKLYVWGGYSSSKTIQTADLEIFDETWQQPQKLRGRLPDSLSCAAVTADGEIAYTFGGTTDTYCNTLYQINMSTLECIELVPVNPSHAPKKTSGSAMVHFKDKLVVYGGYTGQVQTSEMHVFDLKSSGYNYARIR